MARSNVDTIRHFYINLDRSSERRRTIEFHLKSNGLVGQRVAGVDGSALPDKVDGIDPDLYKRCHGRFIRPGEIGCYLSHLKAIKQFLETEDEHCVILEDDAELYPGYKQCLNALLESDMSKKWDMVKLHSRRRHIPWKLCALTEATYLGIFSMRSTGATAYLINRYAAQQMLKKLLPMQVPWDHAFDRSIHLKIKVRTVFPYPAGWSESHGGSSTIETSKPVKATGMDRATTMLWRRES